ncbi:MAG: NAD(P)-dependent oxidoreductase [Burkholderiales bacterium]|nr:MAG: NAD(P)-dependent oxidoreductase [Burkholderiales bacterium]
MTRDIAAFLADDFERLGAVAPALLLDGRRLMLSGATGFFGKNLLALLAWLHRRGQRFEVVGLSRDPARFLAAQPWAAALPWLHLLEADVRDPWPGHGRFDAVVHAATDTHASAHTDPQAVFDDGVAGTRQALAFAAAHGVQRLLLTGSGAQYGELPAGPVPETHAAACDPTQPGSAYGEAKRVGELLATLASARGGFEVVPTRCFAFVGPGLDLHGHFAIGNFIRDALAGGPLRLSSDGSAVRSYLYGADLAWWLLHLLFTSPPGQAINVGSDEGLSVAALASLTRDMLRPDAAVRLGPAQPATPRQHYLPSIHRAGDLGLAVWTPLPLAIRRTGAWHGWQHV